MATTPKKTARKAAPKKATPAQPDAGTQRLIDQAVQEALSATRAGLVATESKPDHVAALRKTWRNTREHYRAQVMRFLGVFGALLGGQLVNDFVAGKPLFDGVSSPRAVFAYIAGVAWLAYKQYRPSMEAAQADTAPGVTIVPSQVGAQTVEVPVSHAEVEVPLPEETTSDEAADVAAAVGEGDAAP